MHFICALDASSGAADTNWPMHHASDESHAGAGLHRIDASRHKFGPLLAFIARFFGIRGTLRWKV
jgi:hypothetical protein